MRIYRNCAEAITDIGRELKKCAIEVHTDTYQNKVIKENPDFNTCLLYTSPSPRDGLLSRMPSSA